MKLLTVVEVRYRVYSRLWLSASFGEELEGRESCHSKPRAQGLLGITVHLGYEDIARALVRLAHLLIGRGQSLAVATPWEGRERREGSRGCGFHQLELGRA